MYPAMVTRRSARWTASHSSRKNGSCGAAKPCAAAPRVLERPRAAGRSAATATTSLRRLPWAQPLTTKSHSSYNDARQRRANDHARLAGLLDTREGAGFDVAGLEDGNAKCQLRIGRERMVAPRVDVEPGRARDEAEDPVIPGRLRGEAPGTLEAVG